MLHADQWLEVAKSHQHDLQMEAQKMHMAMSIEMQHRTAKRTIVGEIQKVLSSAGKALHRQLRLAQAT